MINLTPSSVPTAGQRFCLSVSGFVGSLSAEAEVNGMVVPLSITYTNGHAELCLSLPSGSSGSTVLVYVVDAKGRADTYAAKISK